MTESVKAPTTKCRLQTSKQNIQAGFSLVTAIFLLVVLASLGAMMVTFFTNQQQSSAKDVLGSRAYQAARGGIEWAAFFVSQQLAGSPWMACPIGAVPVTIITFVPGTVTGLAGTLAPFNVVVRCNATGPVTDGTSTIYIYDITSTATGVNGAAPGSVDYVERVINVRMGR